ncbi:MAG: hypothetical protein SXV54_27050, partial [Chloroflexota bacterium]|nr:hypothetical protein [Chloroflexota bacterium]
LSTALLRRRPPLVDGNIGILPAEDHNKHCLKWYNFLGKLQGQWGWLEVLREAATGDTIHFFQQTSYHIEEAIFTGTFLDIEGKIYLSFEGDVSPQLLPHEHASRMGNHYLLKHWVGPGAVIRGINANHIYYHTKFDASKFDWVGAAFDIGGIIADSVSGIGGRGVNVAEIAAKANKMGFALDVASFIRTGVVSVPEGLSDDEKIDLFLDAAGLGIPIVPDALSLIFNIHRATYQTP